MGVVEQGEREGEGKPGRAAPPARRPTHDAVVAHSTGHVTALSLAVRSGAPTTPVIELETVTVRLSGGR